MLILIAFIGSVCWDLQCYCQNIVECPPEDGLCVKDPLGYEAIQQLHIAIDDDHDGTLDRSESDEVCSVVVLCDICPTNTVGIWHYGTESGGEIPVALKMS